MTIFLALTMLMFLSFCLVLIEGTRIYFQRVKMMQAMELAEFSVLSEYQQELFEHYGLFFLELDYEQGSEHQGILEQRARDYLIQNAEEIEIMDLQIGQFCRATDGKGSAFFHQAVELVKLKSGYRIFEELFENIESTDTENVNLGDLLEEHQNTAEGVLEEFVDEEGLPIFQIELPDISFPSLEALTSSVLGETAALSEKSVDLRECISERELSLGAGVQKDISLAEMQLFHQYLFSHFHYYGAESDAWKEALEYQLEYIIAGEESDRKNLENIMWKIFLMRAGGNYLFYHQDLTALEKAQTEAATLVGFTGNVVLIEAVKELFLMMQAIEEGVEDTKKIFSGQKVPLYENGVFEGVMLGYEQYLYLLLNTTNEQKKIYRCMDLVEMEVRKKSGYEKFCLDHCTDCFTLRCDYRFSGLFTEMSVFNGGIYENTITRKMYYEN